MGSVQVGYRSYGSRHHAGERGILCVPRCANQRGTIEKGTVIPISAGGAVNLTTNPKTASPGAVTFMRRIIYGIIYLSLVIPPIGFILFMLAVLYADYRGWKSEDIT